jgi:hypothetical protein
MYTSISLLKVWTVALGEEEGRGPARVLHGG